MNTLQGRKDVIKGTIKQIYGKFRTVFLEFDSYLGVKVEVSEPLVLQPSLVSPLS